MNRRTFLGCSAAVAGALALTVASNNRPDDLERALAANAEGTPLVLPPGTWQVSRTLRVSAAGIRGAGTSLTKLVAAPGLDGPVLASADGEPFDLSGLTIEGTVRTRVGNRGARFVVAA